MLILCVPDAILGLRELLDTYPTLIPQLLTPLVTATVRLMSDEVRVDYKILVECVVTPNIGPKHSTNITLVLPMAYATRTQRETFRAAAPLWIPLKNLYLGSSPPSRGYNPALRNICPDTYFPGDKARRDSFLGRVSGTDSRDCRNWLV